MTTARQFCEQCGALVPADARFCEGCGAPVAPPLPAAAPAAAGESPALPASPRPLPAESPPLLWVTGAIAGLVLIAGAALVLWPRLSVVSVPNTASAPSSAAPPATAPQEAAPTPVPTPPGPIVYRKQVAGEGAITSADFKFSIAERDNGFREGWLIHQVRSGGPRFEASAINSVEVSEQAASVWGMVLSVGSPLSNPFNLLVSSNSYRLDIFEPGGALIRRDEGPLLGGAVTVAAR